MASISQIHRGHHRQKTELQETSRLHKTKTDRKMNLLKVLNSLSRQRKYFEEYPHSNYIINTGVWCS